MLLTGVSGPRHLCLVLPHSDESSSVSVGVETALQAFEFVI